MLKIKGKEYSGHVAVGNEEITVIISTTDTFHDIVALMGDIKEVTNVAVDGAEKVYSVTNPISAAVVSPNVYGIRLSTKPSTTQRLEAKNQELSDAIDDILVMMLEG